MATPFTINIFYPDGNPANIRVATKNAWTGKVFYIGRDYWEQAAEEHRAELRNPGIYILSGERDIYIGQAENLRARVGQHVANRKKTFFRRVICVTERASYNNAHFRWMEAHLIRHAKKIGACNLKNGVAPKKPKLGISEEIAIDRFLQETLPILSALEITAFTTQETGGVATQPVMPAPAPATTQTTTPKPKREPISRRKMSGFSRTEEDELRSKILASFQKRENVKLRQKSRGTFCDEAEKFRVYCGISKYYENRRLFRFSFFRKSFHFLQDAENGYIIFGMEGKSKAVALPIRHLEKIIDKLHIRKKNNRDGVVWWLVYLIEENGNFRFNLQNKETLDASPYLLDIT